VDASQSPLVTEQGLLALAQNGKLTNLAACNPPGESVLSLCPALQSLYLLLNAVDMSETLVLLGVHCPELRELTIYVHGTPEGAEGLHDAPAMALAKGCRKLEVLRFNSSCSDALLVALGTYCHQLTTLRVEFDANGSVTDTGMCALAQGCPALRSLEGTLVPPVTIVGVTALATHCPHLRQLDASSDVAGALEDENLAVQRVFGKA
jgi:hypothetical protein